MKALILGAGRGTRVRPLTNGFPKPMLPIVTKPVMAFLVDLLGRHGFDEIVVNTSYRAEAIESYFGDGSRHGVRMAYSFEGHRRGGRLVDEPLGSAGAIRRIQDRWGFFDQSFAVLCGDAIVDLDLSGLLSVHRRSGALATIATASVPPARVSNYGVVVGDENGRVRRFQEKPSSEEAAGTTVNTGIYVFEPDVIDWIPQGRPYDIGGELFPALVAAGQRVCCASLPVQWLDIGRVSDYFQVVGMALAGLVRGFRPPGKAVAEGVRVGLNGLVDPGAVEVVPPVYIGPGTIVEPGARLVGPTCLGAGCVVESGAIVEESIVFDHVRVGGCAHLRRQIVYDGQCVDADGSVLDIAGAGLSWLIDDARSPRIPACPEERLLRALSDRGGRLRAGQGAGLSRRTAPPLEAAHAA